MRFSPSTSTTLQHDRRTWLVVHAKGLVGRFEEGRLAFPTDAEVAALGLHTHDAHRLGSLDDTDAVMLPLPTDVPAPFEAFGLRMLAGMLAPELFGVIGRAMHAADWVTTSRYCGRCGSATKRSDMERCVVCPSCDLHVYPRISPAIITLVRKGDLALLASSAKFPAAFYSTLAGFSEIGESLEQTLVREVKEEVGLTVGNVRYFGSQPWPFPNSLMIGFTAEWESGDIVVEPSEISDAKWFSVEALPRVPPPLSIARRLIDAWVDEVTKK